MFLTCQDGESQLGLSLQLIISFIKTSTYELATFMPYSHRLGHCTTPITRAEGPYFLTEMLPSVEPGGKNYERNTSS